MGAIKFIMIGGTQVLSMCCLISQKQVSSLKSARCSLIKQQLPRKVGQRRCEEWTTDWSNRRTEIIIRRPCRHHLFISIKINNLWKQMETTIAQLVITYYIFACQFVLKKSSRSREVKQIWEEKSIAFQIKPEVIAAAHRRSWLRLKEGSNSKCKAHLFLRIEFSPYLKVLVQLKSVSGVCTWLKFDSVLFQKIIIIII